MTKAVLTVKDPEKIVVSLTLQMTLGEWQRLRDQLPVAWPASNLKDVIYDAVSGITKQLVVEGKEL